MADKPERYDAIVIGAGLFGASAAAALAKDGKKVLVLEAGEKHHPNGSSSGYSRITRAMNFEIPVFNRTAADSLAAMREMESIPGEIVRDMPAIYIGAEDSGVCGAKKQAMKAAGHEYQELSADELKSWRLRVDEGHSGILDRGAGTFDPSKVLDKLYQGIEAREGKIVFNSAVKSWTSDTNGVTVEAGGKRLHAKDLVIATGPWTSEILDKGNANRQAQSRLAKNMAIKRVPVFFFDYPEGMPDVIPVTLKGNDAEMYAMPETQPDGTKYLKCAFHKGQIIPGPESVDRTVSAEEKRRTTAYMEKITGRKPKLKDATVCLYTMTKDRALPLVGALPNTPHTYLMTGGNGISGKHAIALGNALSCRMQNKDVPYDMSAFDPARVTAHKVQTER